MRDKFRGVGVALITPFNEDLSIDYPSLKNLLDHVSNGGVDYLVVNGTTSEASTINFDDKAAILVFVQENNPRVKRPKRDRFKICFFISFKI